MCEAVDSSTVAQDSVIELLREYANELLGSLVLGGQLFSNPANVNFSRMTLLQRGRRKRDKQSSENCTNLSQDSSRAYLASEQTVQKATVHHSASSASVDMFVAENKPTFWPNSVSVIKKKKNHVSFDFICIAFYKYNSVKFQDLLAVFGNNLCRKPAGIDVD